MAVIGANTSQTHSALGFNTAGLGDRMTDNDGKEWLYVHANGAITGAGYVVTIDETYEAAMVSTSNDAIGDLIGVAAVAFADNDYGWVQVSGPCVARVAASCAANVILNTTATAGQLDDDATTGALIVSGLVLTTSNGGSAGTAAAMLIYPSIGRNVGTLVLTTLTLGATTISEAEIGVLDSVTAGTVSASKAIVVDSSKELDWAVTDSGVGTVTPLDFVLTASGVGASVDGAKFSTITEAALGTYANGMNAKLDFGTAGRVTGLGGAMCSELDLGPGTTSGSYAVFEAELNCPASGSLGTRTSFMSLNAWGANVAAVDTGAFLFDLNGLTAASGKLFNSGLSQAVTAAARLRCQVGGTTYYIPLCANEALTS